MPELNKVFLIDSHCHLDQPQFTADREQVIRRAVENEIYQFINPSDNFEELNHIEEMADKWSAISFAAGIHPEEAIGWNSNCVKQLEPFCHHPKCVAIGEIGMDLYWPENPPAEIQISALKDQLALAEKTGLPVIIHCRQAFDKIWPILSAWHDHNPQNIGVLHAFDETPDVLDTVVKAGFYLGIGGTYTWKKKNERREEILRQVPLQSILLETDAPYLTPLPHRGERNEPAFMRFTAEKAAEIRNISLEDLSAAVFENTHRLFTKLV